jgi:outer membrane protein
MMKKLSVLMMVSLGLAAVSTSALADNLRIATVNVAQILQNSPQVAADKKQLESRFNPRLTKIQAAQKNLDGLVTKLKKEGVTMQAQDRESLQNSIEQGQQNLFAMQQSFQQDVTVARQKEMESLLGQLQSVIQKVAKKDGYTIVIPQAAIAYADSSLDVTDEVAKAFDRD